jgi:hypothetical protein
VPFVTRFNGRRSLPSRVDNRQVFLEKIVGDEYFVAALAEIAGGFSFDPGPYASFRRRRDLVSRKQQT